MKLRIAILAALLAAMSGCSTPMQWTRPGASPDEVGQALYNCQNAARQEARYSGFYGGYGNGFYNSYFSNRPVLLRDRYGRLHQSWTYTPFYDRYDPYYSSLGEESRLRNFCMRAQGFGLEPAAG